MNVTRDVLERVGGRFAFREDAFERMLRRRARKERKRRIATGMLAIIVALVSLAALIRAFRTVERPADEPTPSPSPAGIFADVGGWIAYTNDRVQQGPLGIWAVDPTRPNDPEARIQLSGRPGEPVAWSSDGSKLLILRARDQEEKAWPPRQGLFVLKANGTETRVVTNSLNVGGEPLGFMTGGSFSPDGSQVVFSTLRGIYTVDANGGPPRLVLPPRSHSGGQFGAAFSPDGRQIAYLELYAPRSVDEASLSLRVVNADGTGVRTLHDAVDPRKLGGPAWSPDGTHIAYSRGNVLWVVGADGSGITRMPGGLSPYWSPDGSRIAFELPLSRGRGLAIADADGTNLETFGRPGAHIGPWNPWLSAVPGEPAATGSGLAAPFIYAIVLLGVVGVLVLAWRARGRTAAR